MAWKLVDHNALNNSKHHVLTRSEELVKDDYYFTNNDVRIKRYTGKNRFSDEESIYKIIALTQDIADSNNIDNLPIIKSTFPKELYNKVIKQNPNKKYKVYLKVDENDVLILDDKYVEYKIV